MSDEATDAAPVENAGSSTPARTNHFLAAWRIARLLLTTAYTYTAFVTHCAFASKGEGRRRVGLRWTRKWFASGARIMGFRVRHSGPLPPPGSLIAPNHLGYVDLMALGSFVECCFVGKADVESWPFLGHFFKASGQIGAPRASVRGVKIASERIAARLRSGESVCVFLEGTSSGGGEALPFHAPLVQPAVETEAPVIPTGIRWTSTDPAVDIAEDVAYWKDHTFGSHIWRLAGLCGIEAAIRFGEPISASGEDRKALAMKCHGEVSRLLKTIEGEA